MIRRKRSAAVNYKDAGVDKNEGHRAVEAMKPAVAATQGPSVLGGLGSFASLYALEGFREPVLVSGTDGVGTKLRLALDAGEYRTIGRDCFAMVANDILCHGARPLFFLDYLACGKLDADVAAEIVVGMAEACEETGCALVGGETAEMPGFYAPGDYDVAGFAVGAVERSRLVAPGNVRAGDVVIGLGSDGVHSNGFSLIRALFPDPAEVRFGGGSLLEALLPPTRLYVNPILDLLENGATIHGMAHITGGGIPENLPRALAPGLEVRLDPAAWEEPPVFDLFRHRGVEEPEMRGTFNMGIGFCVVAPAEEGEALEKALAAAGERVYRIGEVGPGERGVSYA